MLIFCRQLFCKIKIYTNGAIIVISIFKYYKLFRLKKEYILFTEHNSFTKLFSMTNLKNIKRKGTHSYDLAIDNKSVPFLILRPQ